MKKIKFFMLLFFVGASLFFTSCKKEDANPCYKAKLIGSTCGNWAVQILNADLGTDNVTLGTSEKYDNVLAVSYETLPKDYRTVGNIFYFSNPKIEVLAEICPAIVMPDWYPKNNITSFDFSSTGCIETK